MNAATWGRAWPSRPKKRKNLMKALLLSGLTLALLTGGALAQANGQPPAPPAPV
jgi:hypothetical protein